MANLKPSNTIYIHTHEPKSRKKFTRSNICNHLICPSTSKNETRINPRKKERRKEEKKKNRQFEFSLTYGNTLTNLKQLLSEYTRFVDTGVRIYYGKRREQVPFTPKNDGEQARKEGKREERRKRRGREKIGEKKAARILNMPA